MLICSCKIFHQRHLTTYEEQQLARSLDYRVSQYQKGRTIPDFIEARDDGWQWHQLDHMHIICTSLQTATHYLLQITEINVASKI